ncbi:hypothetical protein IE53DRAFT_384138 [Violaceomyces palustris]|uniref:Uncharacterized protein n=1 Tax=Violaceomyces palustris TaxID=1673888 RepID=A0ACD0P5W7_9BASI|nr:hypothetical protein IE53DRAFT_384138 [Violaceomyces palustris]
MKTNNSLLYLSISLILFFSLSLIWFALSSCLGDSFRSSRDHQQLDLGTNQDSDLEMQLGSQRGFYSRISSDSYLSEGG